MELSPMFVALASFFLITITLASGMWIFVSLGISGLICAFAFQGSMAAMPYIFFDSANSFTLTAILTFVFMGEIMLRSGVSLILFRGAAAVLRFLPGGLYHAVILSSALFAATSGSSTASAATIGRIALPELYERGYNKEMSLGSVAGGSMLANLIPPSLGFIIYGAYTLESVTELFMAGIIPGLVIVLMYMLYAGITAILYPQNAPRPPALSTKQIIKDIAQLVPILAIVFFVLGSLYMGVATPTEAGTVGVLCALAMAAVYRKLTWTILKESTFGAVKTTSMIMILIVAGYVMGSVYGAIELPKAVIEWVASAQLSPLAVLIGIIVFYTILGLFIETIPVFILSIGIIYPLIIQLGYNGIWFGVLSGVVLVAGLITPPVGICLYVVQGVPPGASLMEAVRGSLPYLVILYIMTIILIIWPGIATWLPNYLLSH